MTGASWSMRRWSSRNRLSGSSGAAAPSSATASGRRVLSGLRDSGQLEQDASGIILLRREDAYEPESPRLGESDLILGKNRNGPTSPVTVAHQFHYCGCGTCPQRPTRPTEHQAETISISEKPSECPSPGRSPVARTSGDLEKLQSKS
jgi:hypothetical protein